MSNELTYMDCWNFIASLIPVDTDYTMDIYIEERGRREWLKLSRLCSL